MNATIGNTTFICPQPSDSPLSVAAGWIGIVTFISTTLGSLTILYTLYKTFEKAQEEILAYGQTVALSSKEMLADIAVMEPMLQCSGLKQQYLRNAVELISQIRNLTHRLNTAITQANKYDGGFWHIYQIYKLGTSSEISTTMKDIQRAAQSLQTMKLNLLLRRLDEQDNYLKKIGAALDLTTTDYDE